MGSWFFKCLVNNGIGYGTLKWLLFIYDRIMGVDLCEQGNEISGTI